MFRVIFFILLSFSLQAKDKKGGIYLLTTEPTFYLKKINSSGTVTSETTSIDKKRRLGVGTYQISSGRFLAWEGHFFYTPYSHPDDPKSWRLFSTLGIRLFNLLPFNVGAGIYYGFGSSKHSDTAFHFGSLLSARLRLFGLFLEGRFIKDHDNQKGSNSDASLNYESHLKEYQVLLGITSESFFQ